MPWPVPSQEGSDLDQTAEEARQGGGVAERAAGLQWAPLVQKAAPLQGQLI